MSERGRNNPADLDAFLDGQLSASQQAAFHRRLGADRRLAEEVSLQQAIDGSLKRLYAPQAPPAAPPATPFAQAPQANHGPDRFHRLMTLQVRPWQAAVAAAIFLALGLITWQVAFVPSPSGPYERSGGSSYGRAMEKQTPHEVYLTQVRDGFAAAWACPPARFASISRQRLGSALTYRVPAQAAGTAPEIEILGASYVHVFSRQTVALLARVNGEPVIVLVDRRDRAAAEAPGPQTGDLHTHRADVGPLALYEISPLDQPHLLEMFRPLPPGQDPPPDDGLDAPPSDWVGICR